MKAILYKKKDRPNYYVVIDYKDDTGNRKRKWIATDIPIKGNHVREAEKRQKEELAKFEKEQQEKRERKEHGDLGKDVLFTDFLKEWLENLKPSIDLVTYDTYRLIVYNQIIPFYELKKLKVKDLMPLHIQQYINFKLESVSPNTVRKHIWNISKCLDSAVKHGLLQVNPVKGIDLPKQIKYTGAQYYNEVQIEKLLSVCAGDMLEPIILLAVFYGLRRSEILGLKWNAINFTDKTLTIQHTVVRVDKELRKKDSTKNKSSYRSMPMSDIVIDMLKRTRKAQLQYKLLQPNDYIDEGYIFTHADGRLLSPNYVTKRFKQLLIKNNLPIVRFHDLRHSAASYLLYLGFSMKEIQMWLGHGDIGTTMNIYAHMDIEAKRNIAESLNERFASFK